MFVERVSFWMLWCVLGISDPDRGVKEVHLIGHRATGVQASCSPTLMLLLVIANEAVSVR